MEQILLQILHFILPTAAAAGVIKGLAWLFQDELSTINKEGEMSRNGTCKYCFQIQEVYTVGDQPHDKPERVIDAMEYTCQWLDQFEPLPPAIQRKHGGFDISGGDCDTCSQYEPASNWPPLTPS